MSSGWRIASVLSSVHCSEYREKLWVPLDPCRDRDPNGGVIYPIANPDNSAFGGVCELPVTSVLTQDTRKPNTSTGRDPGAVSLFMTLLFKSISSFPLFVN